MFNYSVIQLALKDVHLTFRELQSTTLHDLMFYFKCIQNENNKHSINILIECKKKHFKKTVLINESLNIYVN